VTEASGYGPSGRSAWLDIDWGQHQRWVRVQDRWVNLVEHGEGKPVLFVHGLGGSWQNWLENIPAVAEAGYRAIAVDLPGFGASEMPAEKISIGGYGRFVEALLEELGTGPVALVGNSMGGFIGAEVAIQFPQHVDRLVLVSAAGISVEHERNERALDVMYRAERFTTMAVAGLAARADNVSRRPGARKMLMRLVAAHPDRLPAPLVAEMVRGAGTEGFLPALDALTDYPIRERLGKISAPTLIVWGTEDRLVPVKDADVFEELIPNARKIVYEDTGHVAMLERPADFNRELFGFLGEQVDAASSAAVAD
jgi:pimeloyl-ACP methyl ester carboxylesterase